MGGAARRARSSPAGAPLYVAREEDERPGDDQGRDELIAAFTALGGPLTGDELMRLLGSYEYYGALVRLAALLLDGDTAAEDVARDSLAALQHAWSRLGDPAKAPRLALLPEGTRVAV